MRQVFIPASVLAILIVGVGAYIASALNGLDRSLMVLREDLPRTEEVRAVITTPEGMKTGTLSKTINGTTITMNYEWDCTVEGWREILEDWKVICDNPPPE